LLRSISPTILLCHDATTARLAVRWRCGAEVIGTGGCGLGLGGSGLTS